MHTGEKPSLIEISIIVQFMMTSPTSLLQFLAPFDHVSISFASHFNSKMKICPTLLNSSLLMDWTVSLFFLSICVGFRGKGPDTSYKHVGIGI